MLQWTDAVDSFASGQSAMIAGIASDTVSYNEFLPDLGDDLGVFYAPADTIADPYIPDSSGPVWAMTNYSDNKEAAWAYIEFMTGPRGVQIQYEVAGVRGTIGVIGPTRMPYERVVSVVQYTARLLSSVPQVGS